MPNPTPAQVAALAAVVGITPETHKHLRLVHNRMHDDRYQQYLDLKKLPDPLGPDADAVWLAPMLVYLLNKLPRAPYFERCGGQYMAVVPMYWESAEKRFGKSMTAALLQACLAARVPEVCRAMGVEA